jgi:hypothetical protein
MRRWSDVEAMIFEPSIDKRTEEKMLRGTLSPEDAPPELARVAALMRVAAVSAAAGSTVGEADRLRQERIVASMAAAIAAQPAAPVHGGNQAPTLWKARQQSARTWKLRGGAFGRTRLVLMMTLGLMLASAGLAFAGVLPAPIQHAASVVLSKVGVHVPDDNQDGTTPPTGGSTGTGSTHSGSGTGTGGDNGNGKDKGKHTGQDKNGNNGKHTGQDKNGNHGDNGNHTGKDKSGEHTGQGKDKDEGDGDSGQGSSHGAAGDSGGSGQGGGAGSDHGHGH